MHARMHADMQTFQLEGTIMTRYDKALDLRVPGNVGLSSGRIIGGISVHHDGSWKEFFGAPPWVASRQSSTQKKKRPVLKEKQHSLLGNLTWLWKMVHL